MARTQISATDAGLQCIQSHRSYRSCAPEQIDQESGTVCGDIPMGERIVTSSAPRPRDSHVLKLYKGTRRPRK